MPGHEGVSAAFLGDFKTLDEVADGRTAKSPRNFQDGSIFRTATVDDSKNPLRDDSDSKPLEGSEVSNGILKGDILFF